MYLERRLLIEEFFLLSHSNWEAEGLTSALQLAVSFSARSEREGGNDGSYSCSMTVILAAVFLIAKTQQHRRWAADCHMKNTAQNRKDPMGQEI